MIRRLSGLALLGAALMVLGVGCSGSGNSKVEVKVTLDGQPVEGATVVFMPADGSGQSASGLTDASGTCKLKTGDKEGALRGKYKPTVTKTPALAGSEGMDPTKGTDATKAMQKALKENPGGPSGMSIKVTNLLPAKYSDVTLSGFAEVEVPTKGTVELALSSK